MSGRWSFSAPVDAPPDAVYAWLTDLREDDHARPAYLRGAGAEAGARPARREVVSREGDRLVVEDHWGSRAFRVDVTLDREAREVRLEGKHGYRCVWRVVPDAPRTRVECEGRLEPHGLTALLAPLFVPRLVRQIERDFHGHIEDLREALAPRPPGQPPQVERVL